MENHPIPQDVTGFKFKLIGSVTVKQFLYILAGGILAGVCLILPFSMIIKVPLAALFGGFGAMLAFVPIEGRPMDVMAKNFIKALPAENQYIYRKKGAEVLVSEYFMPNTTVAKKAIETKKQEDNTLENKRRLLYGALRKSYKPDANEEAVLSNINNYLHESSYSASPSVQNADAAPQPPAPTQIVRPTINSSNPADAVRVVSPPTPVAETPIAKPSPQVHEADAKPVFEPAPPPLKVAEKPIAPQEQTPQPPQMPAMDEPEEMKVVNQNNAPITTVSPNETQNVTTISSDATLKAGFPSLPDTPNVVLGIIKDPRGKILPNILVEIMDTQGIPVRAFKTNALGQFAAATPLPDGEYNVLLEDPRKQHEFDQIHIVLDGNIFEPLEIISTDQREKLRRELFENQGQQSSQA